MTARRAPSQTATDAAARTLRVMVVDDHTLFRRGLIALLQADPRFEVVGEAGDAGAAQRVAQQCRPDVMLLDNHLPGVSGVQALPALHAALPGLRVLMLTMSEDEQDLAAALRGGASGYLLKTAEGAELGESIVRAVRGQTSISEVMTAKLGAAFGPAAAPGAPDAASPSTDGYVSDADLLDTLSPREREILDLVARGDSNKQIARALEIAETTVKVHVQHILRKLQLGSRVQAAVVLATSRRD